MPHATTPDGRAVYWPTRASAIHWHFGDLGVETPRRTFSIFATWTEPDGDLASLRVVLEGRVLARLSRAQAQVFIRDYFLHMGWPADVEIPGRVIAALLTFALGEPPLPDPRTLGSGEPREEW